MGKNETQIVLKRVFTDIGNIENIIKDSNILEESITTTDLDDRNKTSKVFEDTKAIILRLQGDVSKISDYFDENYDVWQNKASNAVDINPDNNSERTSPHETKQMESDNLLTGIQGAVNPKDIHSEVATVDSINETSKSLASNESHHHETEIDNQPIAKESIDIAITVNENLGVVSSERELDDTMAISENDNASAVIESNVNEISMQDLIVTDRNESIETEDNQSESNLEQESKVFLKCIDINKLTTGAPTAPNDSVLIISDSEQENEDCLNDKKSYKKSNKNRTIDKSIYKLGSEISIHKIDKSDKDDVVIVENNTQSCTWNTDNKQIHNYRKTKKVFIKDNLKIKAHMNSDTSSSDSSESDMCKKSSSICKQVLKLPKPNRPQISIINSQNDKKFSSIPYVLLTRYSCEKLKELYLKKKDFDDVRRLTDLSSLKKRKHEKNGKGSDTSSSEKEKIKKKTKQRCRTPSGSDGSEFSNEENINNDELLQKSNPPTNDMTTNLAEVILNDVSSATDIASDKESLNTKKRKSKRPSSDKEKSSNDERYSTKKKWRNDKLLKKKILDSDSDSENKSEDLKKQREQLKREVKKRLVKKHKAKVIVDSDSSSNSSSTRNKKKNAKSESSPSSLSSSSSSDEESASPECNITKKTKSRIKRMKDSSSDENKDTRKTIRKVIAHESLQETTKQAEKDEKERKARIADRQKKYNNIFEIGTLANSSVEKVVLDFDENSKEELLSVDKSIVSKLKPHQAKGIQFMWDACFESLERIKKTNGSGCILAHCMGLGKTLQVIAFVHTLIMHSENTQTTKVMVVCPVNTVLNWVDEFGKWLGELEGPEIEVYELVSNKQNSYREHSVQHWTKHGGVLIIGYDMFRNLTNPTNKRIRKQTREVFHKGMVDPGPDLIVCDEGHLLKNEKTNLSIAISRVRTERRIVLTGTPMQNNMKEYYCMVQFVKPNLLGTYKEYLNRFVNPITNGQYTDSTPHDISIMKKRSHVLHKMLDGVVQRRDYDVLTPYLPPKYEYVVFTKLSEVQIKLYQYYLENFARKPVDSKLRKTAFLFSDFQEFQRICTHPRLLLVKAIENRNKAFFEDREEDSEGSLKDFINDTSSSSSSSTPSSDDGSSDDSSKKNKKNKTHQSHKPGKRLTRTAAAAADIDVGEITENLDITDASSKWWRDIISCDQLDDIALSEKLYLLFEILQQCELIGDKILIFSQSLYSLNIIEYFLAKIDEATQQGKNESVYGFSGSWAAGLDYFRIDGSSSCDNRAHWCKLFNDSNNHRARLFLISTKAGGLGINLVGANRVIIFDVSWNPSHDTQSIYRVYRFGQAKPCYIYRFVTYGTMEMKIYERQVTKQAISKRIIDEQQIDRHYNQNDLAELYNFDASPEEAPTPLIPKDVLLAELLQQQNGRIYKYHEHQSLLENKEEEELDEQERKAAWEEYEHEKNNPPMITQGGASSSVGWIGNLPLVSINAALLVILHRDNPTWSRDQVQAVVPIVIQQLREQLNAGDTLLFNRIVNELQIMQSQQQQKLQQYYIQQQQMRLLQQRNQVQAQKHHTSGNGQTYTNFVRNAAARNTLNPNEIVELND